MAKPISYRRVGKSINDRCETCRNFSKKTGWCSKWKFVANEDYKCNKWVQSIGDVDQDSDLKEEYKVAIGEKLLNRQAIKRFGRLEDISNVVDFLISPKSDFITGQIIYLGGV